MHILVHYCQKSYNPCYPDARGFTLMELMIVVAIVGILSAVAYPYYGKYVEKARRADGQLALLQETQTLERCRSTRFSYAGCTLTSAESPESYYAITLSTTASAYTITATAQGLQATDTDCATMSMNNLGVRTPDPDTSDCWQN
ncbi:MAG: type IV pilin protein [Granulosicoccus sp.]